MASIKLHNITKIYDNNIKAVDTMNLDISDNEFVVLVGPSGCGKSTVLRMIAGLEAITEGEIFIDDKLINDVPAKNRNIAMVFQNYALYPHMTVRENMYFGLKLQKLTKTEIENRIKYAVDILHISELLDRRPQELSGGQRQRVAVGRAIVRKPKLFLFDEPLSNLDAKLRVQMRVEINKLYKRLNTTMLYVTHDQIEAMTLGSKIVVMKDGLIQQIGAPLDLYNNPANQFVASFIGNPSMNFFRGILTNSDGMRFESTLMNFQLPDSIKTDLSSYTNSEVIIGIRPEDIQPVSGSSNNQYITNELPITIDVVEPVGNEIFVYFYDKECIYNLRVPANTIIKANDKINIGIDAAKIYFFDTENQLRIQS